MHRILSDLQKPVTFTGALAVDVPAFLRQHGCPKTASHSGDVAAEAHRLAQRFGVSPQQAEAAGWLHDVSAVFPAAERADRARDFGVNVLPEEDSFPMIIHQKLSVILAREIFSVDDEAVLSAVGCHTTLKGGASLLDKVVFVADKIAWDRPGTPPYLETIQTALDKSIDHAAFVYLDYLWQMRDSLNVLHPWVARAHAELQSTLNP
jgi:predicted HD superfamily hydrolase involved in NAD metabolism